MSPRFGVLLGAMLLSICFIIVDILSVTHVVQGKGLPDGINPFWKMAFVFKCLTDTIVLDDFKTALDRLKEYNMQRLSSEIGGNTQGYFRNVHQAQSKRDDRQAGNSDISEVPRDEGRDWTKSNNCDHIDLETALRTDLDGLDEPLRANAG